MSKKSLGTTKNMTLHTRKKTKSLSCSTPENNKRAPSPVHEDSSPLCGSDPDSPVPFLCTQDGGADTDVVWNYYTPKAENYNKSPSARDTPLSRKGKRIVKRQGSVPKEVPTKKKVFKASQKKIDLFKDLKAELLELNENVQCLLKGRLQKEEEKESGTTEPSYEDNLLNVSFERSQCIEKTRPSSTRHSLRKNVLSTKLPIDDFAIESDDSINECLLKASQMIEERVCKNNNTEDIYFAQTQLDFNAHEATFEREFISCDQLSDHSKVTSPPINKSILKTIKQDSPAFSNDSFENLLCNMNDSDVERLSQMPPQQSVHHKTNTTRNNKGKQPAFTNKGLILNEPFINNQNLNGQNINNMASNSIKGHLQTKKVIKKDLNHTSSWSVNEFNVCDTVSSPKSAFGRHNSMPESPRVPSRIPPTSGTMLSRHNSMPQTCDGDSPPMKCTPDEIKRKHRLAKEKLLAKRLLPFTAPNKNPPILEVIPQSIVDSVQEKVQPKVPPIETKFQFKFKTATRVLDNTTSCPSTSISTNQTTEINKTHINGSYNAISSQKSKTNLKDSNLKAIIERKRIEAMQKLKRKRSQNNLP